MKEIYISPATSTQRTQVIGLLKQEKLPVDDLPEALNDFLLAVEDKEVVAAVGLEKYDQYGLLRSLVVHPDYRNKSIAGKLIQQLEINAVHSGLQSMYLLTETAPEYFQRKGYVKVNREEVPASLMKSSEFAHTCPKSAIVMKKSLVGSR